LQRNRDKVHGFQIDPPCFGPGDRLIPRGQMLNRCVDVDESVAATKFVWRFKVDQRTDWHVSPQTT